MDDPDPVSPYNPSILRVKMPDGSMTLVGEPDQPLGIRGPEGWRIYPGAGPRVRQKQPDGTWLDVVWTPTAGT